MRSEQAPLREKGVWFRRVYSKFRFRRLNRNEHQFFQKPRPFASNKPDTMLHQLIFSKLLGEIDYGAMGDFNPAGYVHPACCSVLLCAGAVSVLLRLLYSSAQYVLCWRPCGHWHWASGSGGLGSKRS